MLTMTVDRLSSIQRASRALLIFFIFMSIISFWSTLSTIAHPYPSDSRSIAGIVFQGPAITDKIHGLWLAQMLLGAALTLKVLSHFIRLMVLYARGEIFSARSVAQIRQAGLTYAGALVIWLIGLIGAAPEISAAQDQWLNIMPSFPLGAIIAACIFIFASRIMDEGRKLREDQDLVV
jgi:DUF2975 family protein